MLWWLMPSMKLLLLSTSITDSLRCLIPQWHCFCPLQLPFHLEKQVATQARGLSSVVSYLAELAYGNRDLWYLIAEANGLANNSDIKAGDTLILPTTKLDDTPSFWLYGVDGQTGPQGELGYWSPGVSDIAKNDALWNTLPHTGGGGGGNCAILGKVLMVVAAVAVTYVTGGAAASAFGSTVLGGAATGAAASVASQAVGSSLAYKKTSTGVAWRLGPSPEALLAVWANWPRPQPAQRRAAS